MFRTSLTARMGARLTLCALLASPAGHAFDVTGGTNAPVRVQADFAELNERDGESVYRGNVVVQQGQSLIEAGEIRIKADENGIASFVATGSPTHMLLYDSVKAEETHAYAEKMEFDRSRNQVILSGSARLQQEGSSFQGEIIHFDTQTQVVSAKADPENGSTGRVEIIYLPKKNKESAEP